MFKKLKNVFFVLFAMTLMFGLFLSVFSVSKARGEGLPEANEKIEINFFHSKTCPHCIDEGFFLDILEEKYEGKIEIKRHELSEQNNVELMFKFLKEYNEEQYFGVVPMTFVGNEFILGYDSEEKIGLEIIDSIERQLGTNINNGIEKTEGRNTIIGVNVEKYSLPVLSVVLGTLDGFNVCSLGALILILGLVFKLKSRKKIILFGGIFLLTTAVVYGLLIFLWHQLFSFFAPYMTTMNLIVGSIGVIGGVYFIKEYLRFRKYGVTCDSEQSNLVSKASGKIRDIFENNSSNVPMLIIGILLFAMIITIVEFPCSAAVPLAFSGVLAENAVSTPNSILYISIFILFYLLDEIIVFGIASYKMSLWLSSPKFTKWATLVEGIVLLLLGLYYLLSVI